MKVPFTDLAYQHQQIKTALEPAILETVNSCSFILGPQVQEFENNFAEYLDAKSCIGVGSGTEALHIAFRALDITVGDEVILPANTFVATAIGVIQAGATPVLVDVNSDDYHINYDLIEAAITPRTKAICPVHLYGRSCDMDKIMTLASKYNLYVVEDAAQSHGAKWQGRMSGTIGDIGCFSFYPGKNLGAYGDAGALVTNNPDLAQRIKQLRNYGSEQKYHHPIFGLNSRLDSVQATVLSHKLVKLDEWNQERWRIAEKYNQAFSCDDRIKCPDIRTIDEHVFHLYVVQVEQRDQVLKSLNQAGVGAGIHYPNPIHLLGGFANLVDHSQDLSMTESQAQKILSLPICPGLTNEQIDYVIDNFIRVLA